MRQLHYHDMRPACAAPVPQILPFEADSREKPYTHPASHPHKEVEAKKVDDDSKA